MSAVAEASRWSGTAGVYAESFARLCEGAVQPLLAEVGPLDGRTLHDVGCGTGAVSRVALERGALVTASDPDPDMRALASELVEDVRDLALPATGLPDAAHDIVVGNFVVNHVPDPRAAAAELARICGETVAVAIWPATSATPARLLGQAADAAGLTVPPGQRLAPELDFDRSSEGLSSLLSGAGLASVSAWEETWDLRIDPATLWRGVEAGIGVMGRTWQAAAPDGRARMRETWQDLAGEYADGDAAVFPVTAVLGVGLVR